MTEDLPKVAVIGGGMVGLSWAVVFARAGLRVQLYTRRAQARAGIAAAAADMHRAAAPLADAVDPDTIRDRVQAPASLEETVDGAIWVQEALEENIDRKIAVFADLDRLVAPPVILATSSSGIGVSRLAADLCGRQRCIVAHPANPPHLIPVVEVVPAPWTDDATLRQTFSMMRAIGQRPVHVRREEPGFVLNRLQGALLVEMFRVVDEGIMTPADVDALIRDGFGVRWAFLGPIEGIALNAPGGIADYLARYGSIYDEVARERGMKTPVVTPALVEALAGAMHERLPPDQREARIAWRDHAMATLRLLRQAQGVESTAEVPSTLAPRDT